MKKIVAGVVGVLLLGGLVGCANSPLVAGDESSSSTPAEAHGGSFTEGIAGADKIKLRYQEIGNSDAYLYCLDDLAYVYITVNILPAPQYDSLCASVR